MFGQTSGTVIGAVLFVGLIVVELWGASDTLPGNTVSEWIRSLSRRAAVVPWAFGVLIGHWFHPVDGLDPLFGRRGTWVLIGLSVALFIASIVFRNQRSLWQPWIWAVAGAIAGSLLWPV